MSYALDVNILLYASDRSSPFQAAAFTFLEDCAHGSETMCLGWSTLMAYLRISTHLRIFGRPLSPGRAMSNVGALLDLPHLRVLSEGERFWDFYKEVAEPLNLRGNFVPDAQLVALLLEHDVPVLYTNDRDFRKFDTIVVRNPL